MDNGIWIPVKVLPGKEALDYFVQKWKESGGRPFNGESEIPMTNDPKRLMSIDVDKISHCISDIDMNTYDDEKRTVMAKCKICGPKGDEVLDGYIKKDVRFTARIVTGTDSNTGEQVSRIITFDAVNRPDKEEFDKIRRSVKDEKAAKRDIALFRRKKGK